MVSPCSERKLSSSSKATSETSPSSVRDSPASVVSECSPEDQGFAAPVRLTTEPSVMVSISGSTSSVPSRVTVPPPSMSSVLTPLLQIGTSGSGSFRSTKRFGSCRST